MRRNSDRPACVATTQRQDAENHVSYTDDTACNWLFFARLL